MKMMNMAIFFLKEILIGYMSSNIVGRWSDRDSGATLHYIMHEFKDLVEREEMPTGYGRLFKQLFDRALALEQRLAELRNLSNKNV